MRLIVYAGREFKADFTVCSDDGVTPEVLDPTDTATFTVQTSGVNPECILSDIPMVIIDADNGLFELTLAADQTALLNQYVGFQEDNYSPIGNHDGLIDFQLASGNRQAMVTLYVKEVAVCPVTV